VPSSCVYMWMRVGVSVCVCDRQTYVMHRDIRDLNTVAQIQFAQFSIQSSAHAHNSKQIERIAGGAT